MTSLEEASKILNTAKVKALAVLKEPEHQLTAITVRSSLETLVNKLNFLSGALVTNIPASEDFGPVTRLFGEDITSPIVLSREIFQPLRTEKELFLENVAKLQSNIRERSSTQILEDFGTKDHLILRKVAQRAGLEDYEFGTLNIEFVDRVKRGLDDNDAKALAEKDINKSLE